MQYVNSMLNTIGCVYTSLSLNALLLFGIIRSAQTIQKHVRNHAILVSTMAKIMAWPNLHPNNIYISSNHPIDESMYMKPSKQLSLFAGFVKENATKPQYDALSQSAITVINKYARFISDTWDWKTKSKAIRINGNYVTLSASKRIEKSAYCLRSVSSGKHQWTFEYTKIGGYHWNIIGIWNTLTSDPATERHFLNIRNNGYAYCGPQGVLSNPQEPGTGGKAYGGNGGKGYRCKSGDVVEMTLDLEECTLSYAVNGESCGVAFDGIERAEYRAAVTLYDDRDTVKLISYRQI